jgi:hypothetical protein
MNDRGTVLAVQKAGRNVKRVKKRKADEIEAMRSGDASSVAPGGPGGPIVRSKRVTTARGKTALNRGGRGGRGRGRGRGKGRGSR